MRPSSSFWIISLALVLAASNVIWIMKYSGLNSRYDEAAGKAEALERDDKVLGFTRMFLDKVLGATGEIDFDTRLALENSVRSLEDEVILTAWQDFLSSQTESEAQQSVKKLLSALIGKIGS